MAENNKIVFRGIKQVTGEFFDKIKNEDEKSLYGYVWFVRRTDENGDVKTEIYLNAKLYSSSGKDTVPITKEEIESIFD